MSCRDDKKIARLYSGKPLFEMNLGVGAGTNSGGLGTPQTTFVPTHKPEDYQAAKPRCPKCNHCGEDEEHYTNEQGCCNKCAYCPPAQEEEESSQGNVYSTIVASRHIDIYDEHVMLPGEAHSTGSYLGFLADWGVADTKIRYTIHVEFDSQGIDGIYFDGVGNIEFTILGEAWVDEERDDTDEIEIPLIIDATKIPFKFEHIRDEDDLSRGIWLSEVEIHLKPSGLTEHVFMENQKRRRRQQPQLSPKELLELIKRNPPEIDYSRCKFIASY